MFGEIINGLGSVAQLGTGLMNYGLQKKQMQYQQGIDQWNQNFSQSQFDYQKQLNERNSITGQVAEMAKNGLNPMTGSGYANGSGSVGGSQISSSVTAPQADLSAFSNMSALGTQLMANAQNDKDREQAKEIADDGNDLAKLIAVLNDKNTVAKLLQECISNGVHPDDLENVFSSFTDRNGKTYSSKFKISDEGTLGVWNQEVLKEKLKNARADTKLKEYNSGSDLDSLVEKLGTDGSSTAIKGILELVRMLRKG